MAAREPPFHVTGMTLRPAICAASPTENEETGRRVRASMPSIAVVVVAGDRKGCLPLSKRLIDLRTGPLCWRWRSVAGSTSINESIERHKRPPVPTCPRLRAPISSRQGAVAPFTDIRRHIIGRPPSIDSESSLFHRVKSDAAVSNIQLNRRRSSHLLFTLVSLLSIFSCTCTPIPNESRYSVVHRTRIDHPSLVFFTELGLMY